MNQPGADSDTGASPIRVLCVDDHPVFRQGLAAVIGNSPELELAGEATTGEEAIVLYGQLRPDITLMDLRLPGIDGVQAIAALRATDPGARIIALTTETGDALIQRALKAGALGYLLKDMEVTELVEVIRSVHAGRNGIPTPVASEIARHLTDRTLSSREVQILTLIADGHRNKQIAKLLSISEDTVKMHLKNAMSKLGAHDRTRAVTIAIQRGFITL